MGRLRDLVIVLVLLALLMGGRPVAVSRAEADPMRVERPNVPRREPTREFLTATWFDDKFCRHGLCVHSLPLMRVKLDGRVDPPFVVATAFINEKPVRTVSRALSRSEFEAIAERADLSESRDSNLGWWFKSHPLNLQLEKELDLEQIRKSQTCGMR